MYVHLRPRQLQFGSLYKIWCKNKREAVKLLRELTDHSSNQSLTCSHPESSHVLRDSEFQGSSQFFASTFLFASLLDTHVYTGNQRKVVVGRTRCYISLNRTIYILAHWCCLSLGGNCTYDRWNSEASGIDYLRIPIPLLRGQTFPERISVLWQFEVHQSYPVQQKYLLCRNQYKRRHLYLLIPQSMCCNPIWLHERDERRRTSGIF